MLMEDPPESSERFNCPRCGAFSHHVRRELKMTVRAGQSTFARNFNDEPGWYEISGTEVLRSTSVDPAIQWTATTCTSCSTPSVWRGNSVVYPRVSSVPAAHPEMPELATELYEEARAVLPDSRRAAAALARASLEALLKSLDDSGGRKNLQTRIGELHGRINGSLWRVLTAIRVVGNDSLHDEEDDLVVMYLTGEASTIVEPLFGAINALVEELITLPRRADELYAMIPESKRESAERARPKRDRG